MNIYDASKRVLNNNPADLDKGEGGVQLLRVKKGDTTGTDFDVKPAFTGKKKGWFYLDSFTASAVVAVYDALNDENRVKYLALPLPKLISVTWKLIK